MISVLIVDDSKTMRDLVKRTFLQAFPAETFEFDEASDGYDFYTKAAAGGKWAVITTDWNMPEMTGIEALKKLKAEDRLKSLPPIVIVTGESTQAMQDAADQIPVSFLIRPLTSDQFIQSFGDIFAKNAGAR